MKTNNRLNFDADNAYFLDQELVSMVNQSFKTLTSPFNAEILIPTYINDDEGADYHKYFMHDVTGKAGVISGHDNTFPKVNVTREAKLRRYLSEGASFDITLQDMRASNMTVLDLMRDKLNSAIYAIRYAQNHMAFYGNPAAQIDGWLNAAGVNKQPVVGGTWDLKTPDEILDELCEVSDASTIATDGAVRTDTLALPPKQYSQISCTPRSAGSDTTILQYFLTNKPNMTVIPAGELSGAFQGGTDGMIAYEHNESYFKQLKSMDFVAHPVLAKTNLFEHSFETRLGGVIVVYPESQQFRYGI